MSRFDAADPAGRRKLFAAGISAHRERASEFCTFEPASAPPESEALVPWIQFGAQTVSMDCTDAELDRLKTLVEAYPDFRINDLQRPESADGTHARISSRSDAGRLASFIEESFREVFGYPADYRVWVAAI